MKGEGTDSCAVLTATTSGHPLSGATGAMEDHPTSIQVSITVFKEICSLSRLAKTLESSSMICLPSLRLEEGEGGQHPVASTCCGGCN
jgi:hypothetical protein